MKFSLPINQRRQVFTSEANKVSSKPTSNGIGIDTAQIRKKLKQVSNLINAFQGHLSNQAPVSSRASVYPSVSTPTPIKQIGFFNAVEEAAQASISAGGTPNQEAIASILVSKGPNSSS